MEQVTLFNPEKGSDIKSTYVEKGKEIYEERMERDGAVEHKVRVITNASPFVLKKGESIQVPDHQARWALKTWGFLQQQGMVNPPATEAIKVEPIVVHKEVPVVKEVVNTVAEDALFSQDPADRLAELKIKGYRNLKGPEREEYEKLKNLI